MFAIPLKRINSATDNIKSGTYRFYFEHLSSIQFDVLSPSIPIVPDESHRKWSKFDTDFIDIPFSDYHIKPIAFRFNFRLYKWEIVFQLKLDSEIPNKNGLQEAGINITAIIVALGVIAAAALVFYYGEQIIYIPAIAIIGAVSVFYWKELSGLLK